MAVDPTYPLYPIFALLSATLLLALLTTNFVRHSWNLGVTLLAFWLFWENLFGSINAVVWSDNADIRLYVYCDVVSHVYIFTSIIKPACTLILTRRLYKIASMRSLNPVNRKEKMIDASIEWFLGLGLPVLTTSVFYYIVQGARFNVYEGSGCTDSMNSTGLEILLMESPALILPLISIFFYCPKIVYVFYRHSRDTNRFLQTNGSVSRSGYLRILALGCADFFLTCPFGIIHIVAAVDISPGIPFTWYDGWGFTHSDWEPVANSWADLLQGGTWTMFDFYLSPWASVVLALAVSALFGFTAEARATYKRGIYAVLKSVGWTPPAREHEHMDELQFGVRSLTATGQTRTQQSTFAAASMGRIEDEDTEQTISGSTGLSPEGSKPTGPALRSGSPNFGIPTIFQAEEGRLSRNGGSSSHGNGAKRARNVRFDEDEVAVPHVVGLHEDVGPPGLACPSDFFEATQTTQTSLRPTEEDSACHRVEGLTRPSYRSFLVVD